MNISNEMHQIVEIEQNSRENAKNNQYSETAKIRVNENKDD